MKFNELTAQKEMDIFRKFGPEARIRNDNDHAPLCEFFASEFPKTRLIDYIFDRRINKQLVLARKSQIDCAHAKLMFLKWKNDRNLALKVTATNSSIKN